MHICYYKIYSTIVCVACANADAAAPPPPPPGGRSKVFLGALHNDSPARYKLTGRGYHAAFFACMWCLFQGIHLDGAVRFLGYFAAAAQTLWHQAFNPILPPGNGVRDTRARQEGEAQKRCITEVLRDPGRQCVQSCFAGADGSMLTDTELEALQRASAAGKLPKGLTGSAHVHAAYDILGATFSIVNSHALPLHHALLLGVVKTFLLRMGEVQVRSRGPGSAMIKFKNFYRV